MTLQLVEKAKTKKLLEDLDAAKKAKEKQEQENALAAKLIEHQETKKTNDANRKNQMEQQIAEAYAQKDKLEADKNVEAAYKADLM